MLEDEALTQAIINGSEGVELDRLCRLLHHRTRSLVPLCCVLLQCLRGGRIAEVGVPSTGGEDEQGGEGPPQEQDPPIAGGGAADVWPLLVAVKCRKPDVVRLLVEGHGVRSRCDSQGRSELHALAESQRGPFPHYTVRGDTSL
jgi:hypothetical protein